MNIPPRTPSPSGSPGEGAIGYLEITIKKSLGRAEQIKIPIPPQGVHEPKATSKQKDQLMELGITKPEVVQNLGSGQAGYMIDQILIARKQHRSGRPGGTAWFILVAAMLVVVFAVPRLLNMNHDAHDQGDKSSVAWTQRRPHPKAQSPMYISGLSPEALYETLGLKQRGFSFEPPDSPAPASAKWTFELTADGKTYEVILKGQGAKQIETLEARISVSQGYDINGPTQTFFGSVATLGSTSEPALAAQKWATEHSNTNEGATFGDLHYQMAAEKPRQRRLVITAPEGHP